MKDMTESITRLNTCVNNYADTNITQMTVFDKKFQRGVFNKQR